MKILLLREVQSVAIWLSVGLALGGLTYALFSGRWEAAIGNTINQILGVFGLSVALRFK